MRSCADYVAALGEDADEGGGPGAAGQGRVRLAASLGTLLGVNAEAGAGAPKAGPHTGPPVEDRLLEALLQSGSSALEVGGERELTLAVALADAALGLRARSRGAWRLRARALEALGRGEQAVGAYERYLELADGDSARAATLRLGTLRERRDCLAEAVRLVGADDAAEGAGSTDAGADADTGAAVSGERDRAFTGAVADEAPPDRVRAAFTACVSARLHEHGASEPAVRRLSALYGTYCRLTEQDRMADPLLGGGEPLGVGDLRNLIAGRTVCVVSNAARVAASGMGDEIDAYGVVVRIDAFGAPGATGTPSSTSSTSDTSSTSRTSGTGRRTDVHAVFHRHDFGHSPQVETRLVFGDPGDAWQRAVRRMVPGAQRYVGDASLRRPVADPALVGESGWGANPTTGFTVLRLLDFLDVSPRIDLIGFALPGQLRTEERRWVMERARSGSTGLRTALR
ncbi:hypothetical protein ACWGJ2_14050 [Streptomyces sp. NPDC054796]